MKGHNKSQDLKQKKRLRLPEKRQLLNYMPEPILSTKNVKVYDFLEFWLKKDIHKRVRSEDTYASYSNSVYHHIIPILGKKKMSAVNRGDIKKLYNDRADYSVSVSRMVKTVMNVSMRYAVEKKIIAENPAIGINLPKKMKKIEYHARSIDTQKTLTMEQILILLEAGRDTPIQIQILFHVLMRHRRRKTTK